MGQAGAIEIVFAGLKDLSFGLETTEGVRKDDAVALHLKGVAIIGIGNIRRREALEVKVVIEVIGHGLYFCLSIEPYLGMLLFIMKASITPPTRFLLIFACLLTSWLPSLQARIGESQSTIEARLFRSGGIVYRDDATELNRQRGMPYVPHLELMPELRVRIYFKSADGSKPKSSDMDPKRSSPGWDIHVLYLGGRSVMEVYKRSSGMTKVEYNQLLKLQAGGSYWKKLGRPAEGEKRLSIFGCDIEREDGSVRAKGGGSLLLITRELDEELARRKAQQEEADAPTSLMGF